MEQIEETDPHTSNVGMNVVMHTMNAHRMVGEETGGEKKNKSECMQKRWRSKCYEKSSTLSRGQRH